MKTGLLGGEKEAGGQGGKGGRLGASERIAQEAGAGHKSVRVSVQASGKIGREQQRPQGWEGPGVEGEGRSHEDKSGKVGTG